MCYSVTGKTVVIGGRLGSTGMSVSCTVEETWGGEVNQGFGFLSDGSISLVWMCCSSQSRVMHHASETTKHGITFHMCADARVLSSGE